MSFICSLYTTVTLIIYILILVLICQVVTETNEDVESSGDEATDMAVDDPMSRLEPKSEAMPLGEQKERETVEAEDGWSVVSSKRNKGKRR